VEPIELKRRHSSYSGNELERRRREERFCKSIVRHFYIFKHEFTGEWSPWSEAVLRVFCLEPAANGLSPSSVVMLSDAR